MKILIFKIKYDLFKTHSFILSVIDWKNLDIFIENLRSSNLSVYCLLTFTWSSSSRNCNCYNLKGMKITFRGQRLGISLLLEHKFSDIFQDHKNALINAVYCLLHCQTHPPMHHKNIVCKLIDYFDSI